MAPGAALSAREEQAPGTNIFAALGSSRSRDLPTMPLTGRKIAVVAAPSRIDWLASRVEALGAHAVRLRETGEPRPVPRDCSATIVEQGCLVLSYEFLAVLAAGLPPLRPALLETPDLAALQLTGRVSHPSAALP